MAQDSKPPLLAQDAGTATQNCTANSHTCNSLSLAGHTHPPSSMYAGPPCDGWMFSQQHMGSYNDTREVNTQGNNSILQRRQATRRPRLSMRRHDTEGCFGIIVAVTALRLSTAITALLPVTAAAAAAADGLLPPCCIAAAVWCCQVCLQDLHWQQ